LEAARSVKMERDDFDRKITQLNKENDRKDILLSGKYQCQYQYKYKYKHQLQYQYQLQLQLQYVCTTSATVVAA
jgi:hypothetical protein